MTHTLNIRPAREKGHEPPCAARPGKHPESEGQGA